MRTVLRERGELDTLGGEGIGEGVDRNENLGDVLLVEEVRGLEGIRDGNAELRRYALGKQGSTTEDGTFEHSGRGGSATRSASASRALQRKKAACGQ